MEGSQDKHHTPDLHADVVAGSRGGLAGTAPSPGSPLVCRFSPVPTCFHTSPKVDTLLGETQPESLASQPGLSFKKWRATSGLSFLNKIG